MDVDEDSDQNLDLSALALLETSTWASIGGFCAYAKYQKLVYWPKCESGNLTNLVCDLAATLVVISQPFLCLTNNFASFLNVQAIRNSI